MATWKEDLKDAAISLGYDFLLVALAITWIAAIVMAILEVSLWVVFGFFVLGCVFFYGILTGVREEEKKTDEESETEETKETTKKKV